MNSLLHWAARWNKEQLLKECIESEFDINREDIYFYTPLTYAVQYKHLNIIKILVENQAELNNIDIYGTTALRFAQVQQETIKNYLESNGAILILDNNYIDKPLRNEIYYNNEKPSIITQKIVDTPDERGLTPFMWSIFHKRPKYFNYYLNELGANINQIGKNGITPLMMALRRETYEMAIKLLEKGAKINNLDKYGNSALTWGIEGLTNIEMLEYLLKNGAQIDLCSKQGLTPLMTAALNGLTNQIIILLCYNANINICNNLGNTALAYAAINGNIENAKKLLKYGADVNLCESNGKTPLLWAVIANNFDMVKLLVENKACVNYTDCNKKSALFYAKKYNFLEMAQFLIEKGAKEI